MATTPPMPFSIFIFLFLSFALPKVSAFSYYLDELKEIGFAYEGAQAPSNWGKLDPKYQQCQVGKSQSPINILAEAVVLNLNLKPLTRTYRPGKASLVNNGVNIGVLFEEDVGTLSVDGKSYKLRQMHWHTPSEHTIDGNRYAAELHLVHRNDDGNLTVVSILYQYGDPDPLLSKLKDGLDLLAKDNCKSNEQARVPLGIIDTKLIKRNTRRYYRYQGSLTTPPCSEPVTWNILGKIRDISKDQVAAIKALLNSADKNNSRPQQDLNGRQVQLYDETPDN